MAKHPKAGNSNGRWPPQETIAVIELSARITTGGQPRSRTGTDTGQVDSKLVNEMPSPSVVRSSRVAGKMPVNRARPICLRTAAANTEIFK
jgi:hypothetical protein